MMKLNMKTIKLAVEEHDIQSCSFFVLFFLPVKIQHIKNDKKVFLDFIQNHQKKNQKKEPTKTGGKKK